MTPGSYETKRGADNCGQERRLRPCSIGAFGTCLVVRLADGDRDEDGLPFAVDGPDEVVTRRESRGLDSEHVEVVLIPAAEREDGGDSTAGPGNDRGRKYRLSQKSLDVRRVFPYICSTLARVTCIGGGGAR